MENYSLSDLAAVTGNENGFGGGSLLVLIVLFLLFGQRGFGGDGFGGAATAATQQEILLGQQFEGVNNKLNQISNGICTSTYELNNAIKDCCCETRLGIAGINAKIDQQTGVFTAMIKDMENARLKERVNSLELKDAMCGVVRYPQAMTYATGCNPFCGCGQGNI